MSPVGSSGAPRPSLMIEQLMHMRRSYALSAVAAKRNTFTGSTLAAHAPAIDFSSAGSVAESSKVCEVPIEIVEPTNTTGDTFYAPGHTIGYDFAKLVTCQHTGGLADVAQVGNVDGTAWTGIECFSAESNTVPAYNSAGTGFAQLRRYVKDPKTYSLVVRNPTGNPNGKVDFTVPLLAGDAVDPLNPDGARIGLYLDPWSPAVVAFVNGVQRARLGFYPIPSGGFVAGNLIHVGLVVWSGVQTGPCKIVSQWSAVEITSFNTSQIGSGMV